MNLTTKLGWLPKICAGVLLSAGLAHAADDAPEKLPAPQKTGGASVLEAIDRRASGSQRDFAGDVSKEELATVLWAATGHNRDGKKWTVPMARGVAPYCKIYVVGAEGAFRYDYHEHALVKVAEGDLRANLGMQPFTHTARYQLILTFDAAAWPAWVPNDEVRAELGHVLAGAMSQNIYLAAQALGLNTRYIMSVHKDAAAKELSLADGDRVVWLMTLGRRAE